MEEVSSIFGYFWFGTSAYLHWKLPYCTALFLRTDFTVACVFRKRSTSTIYWPHLEFGRRISRLWKFRVVNFNFGACTAIFRGTHLLFSFETALGLIPSHFATLSLSLSVPALSLISHSLWSPSLIAASPPPPESFSTTTHHPPQLRVHSSSPGSHLSHSPSPETARLRHGNRPTILVADLDNELVGCRDACKARV